MRLEARAALEVFASTSRLHLAANHPPIRYSPGLLIHGIEQLLLERA